MPDSQRIAVIDLGSNTARLIVMHATPGYCYRLEDEIREVVRLRKGLDAHGLSEEAMSRAFVTLRLFKRFCDSTHVDEVIATATSAVRDAANGRAFVERVRQELGLDLRILDGEREAYYGTIGALNDVALRNGAVVDIGGGSVQISQVTDRRYVQGWSGPLGCLALTERFIHSDPITEREFKALEQEIQCALHEVKWLHGLSGELVALGGAIRNLARMDARRSNYPLTTLHGYSLSLTALEQLIEQLRTLPLAKRIKLPGLRSDRADIILPGALVARAVMQAMGVQSLTVSVNGLREGLFFERFWQHWEEPIIADIRGFGVLNLARIYHYQKKHANHVRFLAGRVFEQLAPLHGYGASERELLDAAALLHDIGAIIAYENHEVHSQTLIITNGLPGFTPREIALIGLLARYHRKGTPDLGECVALMRPGDDLLLLRLAAILRLAEYLERGRSSAVDDVVVSWSASTLRLTLIADEYPAVEIWDTQRNALDLMRRAFEREVLLDSTIAPSQVG